MSARRLYMVKQNHIVIYCGRTPNVLEFPGLVLTMIVNGRTDFVLNISSASDEEVNKCLRDVANRCAKYQGELTMLEIYNGIHWIGPNHNWPCDEVGASFIENIQKVFAEPGR